MKEKTVTAPSGKKYTIKKMPRKTFVSIMKLIPATTDEEEAREAMMSNLVELSDTLLPECVVKPKISTQPTQSNDPNVIYIEDLDIPDIFFLISEIFDISGLSPDKMRAREKFR